MSSKLLRYYHKAASKVRDSRVSDFPGLKPAHEVISNSLASVSNPQWSSYQGRPIYLDPSDAVGGAIFTEDDYESEIRDSLHSLLSEGDFVIEVGSHIAHHAITIRQEIGESGRLLLFEPHPKNAGYIDKTIRRNGWSNVELHQEALSDEKGTISLIEHPGNSGGSVLDSVKKEDEGYEIEDVHEVPTSLLSERLAGLNEVNLLKIDVEGAELHILRDIHDHLSKVETMLLEIHFGRLNSDELNEVFEILLDSGSVKTITGEKITSTHGVESLETRHVIWRHDVD